MREAVDVARELFLEGLPLAGMVDRRLAIDLELFSRGGMRVLEKIEQQDYDVLRARPAISKTERVWLAAGRAGARGVLAGRVMTTLEESYAFCRARRAHARAKNFYYSFLLLSREQRDAMCAIYAFMRYCDDLSDEPGAIARAIERWRCELDGCAGRQVRRISGLAGVPRRGARATKSRTNISIEMIDGVSSDLEPRRIETFDELYHYCYHVASVVGLTTFTFSDSNRRSAAAGREVRHRVSADQYPARCPRRCGAWAGVSAGGRSGAVRGGSGQAVRGDAVGGV